MNKTLLIIVAVVLIGGLGIYLFAMQTDNPVMDEDVPQTDENTNAAVDNTNQNDASEQSTNTVLLAENDAGNIVTIQSASLNESGFVALYRMDSQSDVELIGVSDLLTAGVYTDLKVQIDGVIGGDQIVVAVLYADDGNGEFDAPESDYYLTNDYEVVTDVDVVGTDAADEPEEILEQAQEYLDAQDTEDEEAM